MPYRAVTISVWMCAGSFEVPMSKKFGMNRERERKKARKGDKEPATKQESSVPTHRIRAWDTVPRGCVGPSEVEVFEQLR